ncbi:MULTISPECIES: hypothetical protein [Pseudomonas]|uniref:Uncharacterized protein n=1 Tax=Pseudomonas nitroreducens TaxID=46680 RepID=A0A6G6J7J9_PSENT|nr:MULTISPECIES: hypothetical protein [Pseudomonas]QIE91183.1 hypothetical protein G5B91_33045 [Pseudomonas nitroreducens]UCL90239.1 hypothetical protein LDJ84_30155 [Pseudomonas sp. HS-18]
MTDRPQLSGRDQHNMSAFLGHVLDDYSAGTLSKEQVVSGLAHVLTALDKGNYAEVLNWLEQGRRLIRGLALDE